MDKLVLLHEPLIRLGFFITILAAMMCWELLTPRRAQTVGRAGRWPSNLSIAVLNTLLLRFLFPSTAVGFALFVETQQWGLLNAVMIPKWLAVVVAFLILDLAIYLQHILFHAVPVFWRLHRMHHADFEFDVTTGLRFHPIEILLSMGIKLAVIAALGAPAAAVLIFETLLNATSMFNRCLIMATCGYLRRSTECFGCSWSHRTCIGFTTRPGPMKPIATSVSICLGGIACSVPIGHNQKTDTN